MLQMTHMTDWGAETILFLLLSGHAVADFALQTEWVAVNKNRNIRLKYPLEERAKLQVIWPYLLTSHALRHGLMVFLVTQKLVLGIAETIVHWIVDYLKCEGWYGFHTDQIIHICTKVVWATLLFSNFF